MEQRPHVDAIRAASVGLASSARGAIVQVEEEQRQAAGPVPRSKAEHRGRGCRRRGRRGGGRDPGLNPLSKDVGQGWRRPGLSGDARAGTP